MTARKNRDGHNVLVTLSDEDLHAVRLIREHILTLPWQPYIGCTTQIIRFALRRTVATLAEEYRRRDKRRKHREAMKKRCHKTQNGR